MYFDMNHILPDEIRNIIGYAIQCNGISFRDCPLKYGEHEGKLVTGSEGIFFYFKDNRIPERRKYWIPKYRLFVDPLNAPADVPFVRLQEKIFENDPIKLFIPYEKHKSRVPEKLTATKISYGYRFSTVHEYTKSESYIETTVSISEYDVLKKLSEFSKLVKDKIKANDKFLEHTKNYTEKYRKNLV
jgi:hypothetical protein